MNIPEPVFEAFTLLEGAATSLGGPDAYAIGLPGAEDDPTYDIVAADSAFSLSFNPADNSFTLDRLEDGELETVQQLCGHPRCAASELLIAMFAERVEQAFFPTETVQ